MLPLVELQGVFFLYLADEEKFIEYRDGFELIFPISICEDKIRLSPHLFTGLSVFFAVCFLLPALELQVICGTWCN